MTETEKVRAILHELGVEYRDVNSMVTDVEHDGIKTRVYDYDDGPDHQLCVEQKWLTAEEAVRVALGIKSQEVLERRIGELCAEVEAEKQRNANLFALLKHESEQTEKLRELVRWMYDRMDESCAVQYPYAPTPISYDRLMQALARARELGIEVN